METSEREKLMGMFCQGNNENKKSATENRTGKRPSRWECHRHFGNLLTCRTQRGWGAPHPDARRPVGLPSQDPCSSRKQRRQETPRKAWGRPVLVPKPGQTAVLPAVSTAPPPSETTSAQLKHRQARSWSVIASWTPGKKGLSYMDAPHLHLMCKFPGCV